MTLEDFCRQLGWNAAELARQSGMDRRTAQRALDGEVILARAARDIAEALSRALGRTVHVGDIEGLTYR